MVATSGVYNSLSINNSEIIIEAFERVGIIGDILVPQQLKAATRSLNFLLSEWMSKSINLWSLQTGFLSLNEGQSVYPLPAFVDDVTQVNLRTYTPQLGGTPNSTEGVAANAFDYDAPNLSCNQQTPNGSISYNYRTHDGEPADNISRIINFVGIEASQTGIYNIRIEYSLLDPIIWHQLLTIPTQEYVDGVTQWFNIPSPVDGRAYRIHAHDGTVLKIRKIYFANNVQETPLGLISRSTYLSYSLPNMVGRPTTYYLDKQIIPSLNIWPAPSSDFTVLEYSWTQMLQDVGALATNTPQIPARFYQALVWGLSWMLATKYAPDRAEMSKANYDQAFQTAARADSENAVISFQMDYNWGSGGIR